MASKAVRSCAKKRKDATRSSLATLEELENLLHGARDRLGKLGEQASEAAGTHTRFGAARVIMRELGASVEAVASLKKVKTGHKALHISISKLGKAVEKEASELFLHSTTIQLCTRCVPVLHSARVGRKVTVDVGFDVGSKALCCASCHP